MIPPILCHLWTGSKAVLPYTAVRDRLPRNHDPARPMPPMDRQYGRTAVYSCTLTTCTGSAWHQHQLGIQLARRRLGIRRR
jgi:hypothetical protein